MNCVTGRTDCKFLKNNACVSSIICCPTVTECETANFGSFCSRILIVGDKKFCSTYTDPKRKWLKRKDGSLVAKCPFCLEKREEDKKRDTNPLKASKKAFAGKK